MRLLRYGPQGQEKPGVLDGEGNLRELSSVIADIDPSNISPHGLRKLASIDPKTLPLVRNNPRLGVPVQGVSKFIAIGLNYTDHAKESNMPIPTEPIVFMKAPSCLCGPNDDQALIMWPGYCVVNDVSERNYQLERGGQWDKGKGFDTFGPVGPYLVTQDEVGDVQNLDMWLDVNGERMQTGNTRTMILDCAKLVSYLSECMTLLAGDIICTGTPPGVGLGMKPPRYLQPGEVMSLGIEKLGEQRQRVVPFPGR